MYITQPTAFELSPYKDGSTPSGLWVTIGGTLSISSNKYSFAATTEVLVIADLRFARVKIFNVDLGLTGVQTPTDLNGDIEIGLKEIVSGQKATFLFDQSGNNLVCGTVDESGNAQTAAVAWNTTWNGSAADLEIQWTNQAVRFLINGVEVAKIVKTASANVPKIPMNVWFKTSGTDTPTVGLVLIDNADQSSIIIA